MSSHILEEHRDYLGLKGRRVFFDSALAAVVKPGDVVADLGCGVGILGMQALQAGAARAYGIDQTDAIELARETMDRAGLGDRYHCIRGSTYQVNLPEQADLIICDHVGYFGFDYGIIAMVADARKRFLKPGGVVMPRRLRLMIAGAHSPEARAKADGWQLDPVPAEYHWLHEYGLNSRHRHQFAAADICTLPQVLGEIDLTADNPDSFSFSARLEAANDTVFDGIACWFECELAEGVWMTNSPLDPAAFERPNAFLPARNSFALAKGEGVDVTMRIRHEGPIIAWTIQPPNSQTGGSQPRQKLSTWAGQILPPTDLAPAGVAPLALNTKGQARALVLRLVDGARTGGDIEEAVLAAHPILFPTTDEIRRFVRRVLASDTSA